MNFGAFCASLVNDIMPNHQIQINNYFCIYWFDNPESMTETGISLDIGKLVNKKAGTRDAVLSASIRNPVFAMPLSRLRILEIKVPLLGKAI